MITKGRHNVNRHSLPVNHWHMQTLSKNLSVNISDQKYTYIHTNGPLMVTLKGV